VATAGQKAAAGLGTAAAAAQAVPVVGNIAGAILGIGSFFAGIFGKDKNQEPERPENTRTGAPVVGGEKTVSGGVNPARAAMGPSPVAQAAQPALSPVPQVQLQQPTFGQPSALQTQQDAFMRKLILRNEVDPDGR